MREKLIAIAVLLLAIAGLSPDVVAQPGGFGGGGHGGGFRGFGPAGRGAGNNSGVMLLRMPEVRKELSIRDEQTKAIDELADDLQEQIREVFGRINFRDLQDLSDDERQATFAENRKKTEELGKQADLKLEKLLDAPQLARLSQLRVQREGAAALVRPEISKELKLSEEQASRLRNVVDDHNGRFGEPAEELRKVEEKELALLNPEQKAKLAELKGKEFKFPEPQRFGPGGGRGGPMARERKLVKQFDKDGDGRLNVEERNAARKVLKNERANGPGGGGFGPRGGRGGPGRGGPGGFGGRRQDEPGKPGPKVNPEDVKPLANVSLYDSKNIRTLFLKFDNPEWESELADFNNTDVEVPATLIADGTTYPNVGVHFRGMSSFFTVSAGSKRSLNLSLDFVDSKQRLLGYKTLNLLNAHEDPTFLHTVLYFHIARNYLAAPKANFVKLVINGESWGLYTNAQQFNKEFTAENFGSGKGTRWKVRGSPGGDGGLSYVGDKREEYERRYEIKSGDNDQAWKALIDLCKTLSKTPPEKLEEALKSKLDTDGVLWFLALDNALINSDGYWIRASDYSIFLDAKGMFHVIPHDANETFQPAMGPGMGRFGGGGRPGGRGGDGPPRGNPPGGGPRGAGGGRGVELDPLIGLDDSSKPLRSKLLAVPALRKRYLEHVRTIATEWLDWEKLGPVVREYRSLIEKEVEADTRKLSSYAEFQKTTGDDVEENSAPGRRPAMSLRQFAEQRRKYLLNHPEIKKLGTGAGSTVSSTTNDATPPAGK